MRPSSFLSILFLLPLASSADPIRALRSTDIAPGAGGQTFENFAVIGFDDANNFYFTGPGRGSNTRGIWKIAPSENPTPELLISHGDPGPGPASGVTTYADFVNTVGVAPDGTLAVYTVIDSGDRGILLGSGASNTFQLALTETTPDSPRSNDTYYNLERFSVENTGFFAAIARQPSPPYQLLIFAGTPGATAIEVSEGDPSPAGSPFDSLIGHSLFTSNDHAFSFTAGLENDLTGLFLKKMNAPVQTLLMEGATAPGTTHILEGIRKHSRSPGGYIAIAVLTPDPDPNNIFPKPVDRMLVGTETSFTEISPDQLLPDHAIRARGFSEITAFDTGAFFNYSYGYFEGNDLKSHKALVRTSGLDPQIEIIAQSNQAAPGFPDGWRFDPTRQFFPTTNPRSDGTVVFGARITNSDDTQKEFATYFSRPGEPLTLVGIFGDTYELEPDVSTTISQIGFGSISSSFPFSTISPDGSVFYLIELNNPPSSPNSNLFDVFIDYSTPPVGDGQTYAQWAAANSIGAPLEDDDFDGVSNLLEFLLAGDALDPEIVPSPEVTPMTVTLVRNSASQDAVLTLEASTDLINWSTTLLTLAETTPGPGDTETLTYTVPVATPSLHVRARAVLTNP